MSFNIRTGTAFWDGVNSWGNRKQMVVDVMASNAADVFGLQEALDYQVENIQKGLPQYGSYAAGRGDGKSKGESCAIFYRKDRFERLDCGTFWFSESPDKPGSKYWDSIFPRICSWVHLKDRVSGKAFYLYNVHLDLTHGARKKSVELLARKISERKTDDPFIITGDFNMEMDNSAMRYLCNIDGENPHPCLVEAWSSVNDATSGIGTTHSFTGYRNGPKIDHIPISANIKVLGAKIERYAMDGRYPSDHFPVVAILQLL